MGDIVVLLPGITGSVLTKDGKDVFGLTVSAGLRALFSAGGSLAALAVPSNDGEVEDVEDGIEASSLAADAHLIPGLWKIDGYGKLAKRLGQLPGVDLRPFPYDWRRDNRVAARKLKGRTDEWLVERRRVDPNARLVLVAHSMGGLVARYYLEVLGGWRDTRFLITFGTPFRGSLNAVGFLANGLTKLGGLINLTEMLRSCPSVYQLLPIYQCVDEGNGELVGLTELRSPIPGIDPGRVAAARVFHQEISESVARNRDVAEYRDRGYRLRQVVGAEHPTMQVARVTDGAVNLSSSWDTYSGISNEPGGDGTVSRLSATPVELGTDDTAYFSGTRHASLQNADGVLTHIFRVLTAIDLGDFRGARPAAGVSLELDDVNAPGQPVRVRVSSAHPTDLRIELAALTRPATEEPGVLEPMGGPSGVDVAGCDLENVGAWREVELPPQRPGCYRLKVSGSGGVQPASDLLVVAPS